MRWLALFITVMCSAQAAAHRFAPSLLEISQLSGTVFNVTWKTPIQKVSAVPIKPRMPEACELISTSGWVREGTGEIMQMQLDCPAGLVGSTLRVTGLGENQSSALLRLTLEGGVFHQHVYSAEAPDFLVPAEGTQAHVAVGYSWLGAEHIWAGPDHLLFVMGLLLLVGWNRRLIYTVTAFTIGHSVTLALVTLNVFQYPVALVEFLIAVSIFMLAVELSRTSGAGRLWRQPWWLAGSFGLLHGMGFAGALAETGLPQSHVPLALLFFNIGIELGQLAFIGILIALAAIVQRLPRIHLARWQSIPVLILGALSAMWCIERGMGLISAS